LQDVVMDALLHKLRDLQAYGDAKDCLIDDLAFWQLSNKTSSPRGRTN